jgi:hypothetical protein
LDFFRAKGYEVVFSDPEKRQCDYSSGELTGEIQCRRHVMRKELGGTVESGRHTLFAIIHAMKELGPNLETI